MKLQTPKNGLAFTLIEILVSVSIVMILTSLGLANWTNYNNKKGLESRVLDLIKNINKFRQMAVSGEKPQDSGCAFLKGYEVMLNNDCSIDPVVVCEDTLGLPSNISLETILAENLSAVCGENDFVFESLSGNLPVAEVIDLTYHEQQAQINISETGYITWQEVN